jgi:hypothetical protein
MKQPTLTPSGKPFDLHERLLLFACDVVRAVEFLHKRGAVGRALSYQILSAGTSIGSNYEESDEIVRILATIVHKASRRRSADCAAAS